MAAWPGGLPQFVNISPRRTRQNQILRSKNDAGPPKQRRKFTANLTTFDVTMTFTGAQMDIFDTFFDGTINGGVDEFSWVDPFDNSAVTAMRFTRTPTFTQVGQDGTTYATSVWRGSMQLEVLPT